MALVLVYYFKFQIQNGLVVLFSKINQMYHKSIAEINRNFFWWFSGN